MRISASLTLISLLAGFAAVAATACDLSSGSSCRAYDGCYPDYGGSGGFYGPTPGAGQPTAPTSPCTETFTATFAVPEQSGDCQLALGVGRDYLEGAFYGSQAATYFFAQPVTGETTVPCEVIDGPPLGRCAREGNLVVLASTSLADVTSLRAELAVTSSATTFEALLTCARIAVPQKRTISFGCAAPTLATPTPTPTDGDSDASADAGSDADDGGGDAEAEAACPGLLHGDVSPSGPGAP